MDKKTAKIIIIILSTLLIIYTSICGYTLFIVSKYDDKLFDNMFINSYDISNMTRQEILNEIDKINNDIKLKEIIFKANEKEYKYTLNDIGISIDKDTLANEVLTYSSKLNNVQKLKKIIKKEKVNFEYKIIYDEETIKKFVSNLETTVNKDVTEEKLVMDSNRNLKYVSGSASFKINVENSYNNIISSINNITSIGMIILDGTSVEAKKTNISTIDTKVSTFTTTFDETIARAKNVKNAAKSLDGIILQPGEIFSFYKGAGPYSKSGYVYYHGMLGSGVCQVATTIYNTELIAGLKTVERYSHAEKMWYVDGGRDATVAANSKGPTVNLRFKNTYKYPIYISSYTKNGKLTIEFWSNKNAKNGYTYQVKSEKISAKGYKTYRITYKDGKEVSKKYIATTWYSK